MRRVERLFIDEWVVEHSPNAMTKLSNETKIPAGTLGQIRGGRVPRNELIIKALCETLGVSEDELFPPVSADENETTPASKRRRG